MDGSKRSVKVQLLSKHTSTLIHTFYEGTRSLWPNQRYLLKRLSFIFYDRLQCYPIVQ